MFKNRVSQLILPCSKRQSSSSFGLRRQRITNYDSCRATVHRTTRLSSALSQEKVLAGKAVSIYELYKLGQFELGLRGFLFSGTDYAETKKKTSLCGWFSLLGSFFGGFKPLWLELSRSRFFLLFRRRFYSARFYFPVFQKLLKLTSLDGFLFNKHPCYFV